METPTGVSPELSVRRGREAVEFYKDAFGAVEIYRVAGTDAHPSVVSRLAVGNGSFWVADEESQTLELRAFSNDHMGAGQTFRKASFGQGSAGWVAANRQPMHADDAFTDGNPGIGFFRRDCGSNSDFGFTSVSASGG